MLLGAVRPRPVPPRHSAFQAPSHLQIQPQRPQRQQQQQQQSLSLAHQATWPRKLHCRHLPPSHTSPSLLSVWSKPVTESRRATWPARPPIPSYSRAYRPSQSLLLSSSCSYFVFARRQERLFCSMPQHLRHAPQSPRSSAAPGLEATSHLDNRASHGVGRAVAPESSRQGSEVDDAESLDDAKTQHLRKHGFVKSDKADKAMRINLSARLPKDGGAGRSGWPEVWRLIKVARPEAKSLGVAVMFLLTSSAISMSVPMSVGRLLDVVTKGEGETLMGLTQSQFFGALACVLTVGAVANYARILLLRIIGERVVARLRSQLFRRTFIQDGEFFDANRVGDLISRLGSDTVIVGKGITQNLSDGLRSIISTMVALGAMAWLSMKLCGVLLMVFPPILIAAFFYGRAMRNISRQMQKLIGSLTKVAEERIGNVKTSQTFTGEIQEVRRYSEQVRKVFYLSRKESFIAATFFGSTGWAGNMTIVAMLVSGGGLVRTGAMSIGDLTSFMMYTAFAGSSLVGLSGFYSDLMKSAGAASRLFDLQDRRSSIPLTRGTKVTSALGPITFHDVTFAYPTRPEVMIFNKLNFTIPSGSNVCIVAPSGGGKSTIASLLLRFYQPSEGRITINGVDIATMNLKSLRHRIGMVAQEPVLFSGTIAENIVYGRPNASRAEIITAAQKANCQFIADFPEGLETQVGARGAQLSGGQKQRIAIARALLKDPDILILDEATSALDAESETLVNQAMAALMRGRSTTISIAHRLSTIQRSDRVVVLDSDGRVVEVGTYTALSTDPNSAFSKLMEWQLRGGAVPESSRGGQSHITEGEEIEHRLENQEAEEEEEEEVEEDDAEGKSKSDGGVVGTSARTHEEPAGAKPVQKVA